MKYIVVGDLLLDGVKVQVLLHRDRLDEVVKFHGRPIACSSYLEFKGGYRMNLMVKVGGSRMSSLVKAGHLLHPLGSGSGTASGAIARRVLKDVRSMLSLDASAPKRHRMAKPKPPELIKPLSETAELDFEETE